MQTEDEFIALNSYIRKRYREEVDKMRMGILMISKFSSSGGIFSLYFEGKKYVVEPVPIMYQYLKSVSHIPLALLTDNTGEIQRRILSLYNKIRQMKNKDKYMLLMEDILLKAYNWDGTEEYLLNTLWPLLAKAMTYAVEIQVCSIRYLLDRWMKLINDSKNVYSPDDIYGLVISKWEISDENIHYNIMRDYISEDHIIQTDNPNEEDDIHSLRRNILDKQMVKSLIPDPELVHSYSGRRDLLGLEAIKVIECPYKRTERK